MLEWLERLRERRRKASAEEHLLGRDGCVLYCRCRAVLNDSACEAKGDDTYIYTCACGGRSRFLFGPPAPVLLQFWDQAGREVGGGSGSDRGHCEGSTSL